jgi:NAD(P)-dependent dehydrogenase (short-subunit alcohol dehydrogenase family)
MGAMHEKTCVVTGASSGIGLAAAAGLAARGARVLMICRSRERGEAAAARIRAEAGSGSVELLLADLSSQAEVRRLAGEILEGCPELHVLVNNAGVALLRRSETVDAIETVFATNHLAPFLLTNLLLERLARSGPARIVTVSSALHARARIDFDDLEGRTRWSGMRAYNQSKLANLLFTYELARRLEGTRVVATALHPGVVATGLGRRNGPAIAALLRLTRPFMISPERGAATIIHLASAPEIEGLSGSYFARSRPARSSPESRDEEAARRLWKVSAQMGGIG